MTTELDETLGPHEILRITTTEGLQGLTLQDFRYQIITDAEFDHIFDVCDARWQHSGDPTEPHVRLTSGLHSNGFVNCGKVLCYTNLCEIMADQVIGQLRTHRSFIQPDWTIASDHAAAALGHDVGRLLNTKFDFTEKTSDGQVWKRHQIPAEQFILHIEELVTTTKTINDVRNALQEKHPGLAHQFLPVGCLVHRSATYEYNGQPILFVRHYDIDVYDPAQCPLCKAGSEVKRPKGSWKEFSADRSR